MGLEAVGPVKVIVTPKSGTEELRWWRVVMSIDGRASGRLMAREEAVASSVEPIESWAGR